MRFIFCVPFFSAWFFTASLHAQEPTNVMKVTPPDTSVKWDNNGPVNTMPEFPGGQSALMAYLRNKIQYPAKAVEEEIQGKVYIRFTVDEEGSVTDVKVIRGIGGGCDEEAMRVVKAMPKWKPGTENGRPVKTLYNLPVSFLLE